MHGQLQDGADFIKDDHNLEHIELANNDIENKTDTSPGEQILLDT
jgi:hypothetical protein